jgi:hypothetical protein
MLEWLDLPLELLDQFLNLGSSVLWAVIWLLGLWVLGHLVLFEIMTHFEELFDSLHRHHHITSLSGFANALTRRSEKKHVASCMSKAIEVPT